MHRGGDAQSGPGSVGRGHDRDRALRTGFRRRIVKDVVLESVVPNRSVHFPQSVLAGLARIAEERGMSRNRPIGESCRRVVEERKSWPADLFSNDHLSETDWQLLRKGEDGFLDAIASARRSRVRLPS